MQGNETMGQKTLAAGVLALNDLTTFFDHWLLSLVATSPVVCFGTTLARSCRDSVLICFTFSPQPHN
jgi:hypothetical protein